MNWALRDPLRFLRERDELDKLCKSAQWLKGLNWRIDQALAIEVEVDLEIHSTTYAMRLTYPDLFPETPAYIRPRDPNELWSGHQYGPGGVLCLEWRADNWDPSITGADLVRSAYNLLSTEHNPVQPGEVASAHQLSAGQELRGREHRFVCTEELMAILASAPVPAARRVRTRSILHKKASVCFVSRIEHGDSIQDISDLPKGISSYGPLFAWPRDGHVFKSEAFDHLTQVTSMDELADALTAAGFLDEIPLLRQSGNKVVLLAGTQPTSLQAIGLSCDENPTFDEYSVLFPGLSRQRLPSEHENLQKIKVGIVGLGSLGSKIAISLARSGITRFLLIDDDVLLPGNVCRHELSWEAVGMHKAEAVREALTLVAPAMDIEVRLHRVAGQESAMAAATALKDLTSCNVLIDATANPEVFLRLAAASSVSGCPMCWGEVFAGGFGGLIARARPNIDPDPAAVRAAILGYLDKLPTAPYRQADDYNIGGSEPAIAYDSEVAQIAAALTRLALDLALKISPSAFPHSAYLIGLRKEWIFTEPFDTYPIEIIGDVWSPASNLPVREEDRVEVVKVLLHISAGGEHVNADSST